MEYNERMNAITRLVLILTIVGYVLTKSTMLVVSSFFTIIGLVVVYKNNRTKNDKKLLSSIGKEGFTNNENFEEMKDNFEVPTSQNPLQNLNAKIENNVEKKSAAHLLILPLMKKLTKVPKHKLKSLMLISLI